MVNSSKKTAENQSDQSLLANGEGLLGLKVEKDVPLPPSDIGKKKYPWQKMNIGDSFFIAVADGDEITRVRGLLNGGLQFRRRRYGERHATRSVVENGIRGVRVWRTA